MFTRLEIEIAIGLVALVIVTLFVSHVIESIRADGAAACVADHNKLLADQQTALVTAQAQAQADADAKQATINQKDAAYAVVKSQLQAAQSARASDAERVRIALGSIAQSASQAASSASDPARSQDELISRGAGILSEGYGLVGQGVDLVKELAAQLNATQAICFP